MLLSDYVSGYGRYEGRLQLNDFLKVCLLNLHHNVTAKPAVCAWFVMFVSDAQV